MRINKILIFTGVLLLMVSGFLFSQVENVSNSPYPSEDAFVAIGQNGYKCVVWVEKISSNNHKIYYSIRKDGTWSNPALIYRSQSAINATPHVSKGANTGFACIYHDISQKKMKFTKYTGSSWTTPSALSQTGGYHLMSPRIVGGSNKVVISWERGAPLKPEIYTRTWKNNSWSTMKNVSNTGSWTSKDNDLAMTSSGKTYCVWREKQNPTGTPRFDVMMTNDGGTGNWSKPFFVTDGSFTPYRPTVAVNKNGNILVGFFAGGLSQYYLKIFTGGKWLPREPVGDRGNHTDHDKYYSDACEYGSGFIFIFRDPSLNIQYAIWDGQNFKDSQRLTTGGMTYRPAVDYSATYGAVATWTDRRQNDVMFTYIYDDDDDSNPPPIIIPNKPPVARFSANPTQGLYPLPVNFDASASTDSDGQIVKYKWVFGDGGTGSDKIMPHTYQNKGEYTVSLVVTDDDGDSGNTSKKITVLGIEPPLNIQYELQENRNLFSVEYIYKVTWNRNPKNQELGSNVIYYNIFRREKGVNSFAYFASTKVKDFNEYFDRTLGSNNKDYEYTIVAIDSEGRESEIEQEVEPDFLNINEKGIEKSDKK